MKTFKPQGAELVEEARMEKPDRKPDGFNAIQLKDHYIRLWREYNEHLKSITRYAINPEQWKGITQVKEGEFEVVTRCNNLGKEVLVDTGDARQCPDCYLFAIPKREEDLFKTAMDNDWSAKKAIAYILEHYTLTKK